VLNNIFSGWTATSGVLTSIIWLKDVLQQILAFGWDAMHVSSGVQTFSEIIKSLTTKILLDILLKAKSKWGAECY